MQRVSKVILVMFLMLIGSSYLYDTEEPELYGSMMMKQKNQLAEIFVNRK